MYLKRLDMLGFKSFALRTQMEFSTGITAVVGPNGAGKSNVADAMRWVLGEQSMRQLRGKKSDDIIFVGGHGKAPLGLAEVSLTLDNSTGWVPSEYSEITVTRRSYRSGENEYLINKQKVRLKDVVLLLAQARIGHDSYTVVGQGLIDAALSLRAEERRGLFEDAAGIRPFQVQRADAENRLRSTEQNLDRLRDIVGEIEPRLAPLAQQARRAAEFTQLNSELQDVLLTWYALQWRRLRTVKDRAEVAELEQAQHVRQLERAIQAADEQGYILRSHRQHAHAHIADVRTVSAEAHNAVQKIEREVAVCEERITGLARQQNEQQQEERRLRERLIAVQRQIIDQEEQCAIADDALDSDAAILATLEGQVAKAQKEYEMDERRLRGAQSDLIQVRARLGASQSDLGRQQKHLGERNRTLAARRETIAQSQQTLRTLETRIVDERAHLHTARNEEQQVTQRKQSITRAIADAQQEMERLKTMLAEAERQRRTVSDRLNLLKNWRQSLSGYSDGVRALLRAPAGKITGLIAPVPQLGVAPAGMEAAMEAALGQYLQSVVVETIDDAYTCLRYLQLAAQGKALVVWMRDGRKEKEFSVNGATRLLDEEKMLNRCLTEQAALREGVSGFAWRHIQCEERYLPFFQRILHGVVIVKDVETAQALHTWVQSLPSSQFSDHPFKTMVTLKGEVLHVDGWLAGGNGKEGGQHGLLAHERELRELPQQLSTHVALIEQLNALVSEVQRGQEARRAEQNAVDKELQKLTARINELNKVVNTTQRDLERVQTELHLASSVEQQLASEVLGLEQEVQAAQERVRAHEKSQREMAGLVEEFQREMEERALLFRRQQDELGRGRTALAVKRQEAKALRQQLVTQQGQAQDLKGQIELHLARVKESNQRRKELEEAITDYRAEHEKMQAQARKLTEELRIAEGQAATIDTNIAILEKQNLTLRHTMTDAEVVYRRSMLESQKARDALETLLQQLEEEMGVTDPKDLNRYAVQADISSEVSKQDEPISESDEPDKLSEEEEIQLRRLRRRMDTLRSRIKSLGGYDPDAPQQYEETRTRFEFLSTQIADMEQAALHLRSIIGQLDVTMARQFETTFQAVNVRFREHFTTLFNGGNARLELTTAKAGNDDTPTTPTTSTTLASSNMPTGVDVIVQPPGKKVQDLSLLSGGERALVSAALLFALLEINPPPFCLLDEVDAALDESNVTRFCDILKRLAQRTQFIMITHNRVTMTSAQVIYGVSMGNDSVSRLLSMKLEEAPVAGDR
ncbi:MAG TPA: chromosome segregation protein SMC [Ktedonobacteraceae bacterium]|nr:chromosome segregation protein SMC [Ktedonobacteraceae bacterium]